MFPLPLVVTLAPSRVLRVLLWLLHGLAAVAVLIADLPPLWQAGLLLALGGSLLWHARQTTPPLVLRGKADGSLERRSDDTWLRVELSASSTVLPRLTVLHIKEQGSRRHLVILPDSLPAEDFRRLRVWLRWLGVKHADGPPPAAPHNGARHNRESQ